jgi:hypothetical protein
MLNKNCLHPVISILFISILSVSTHAQETESGAEQIRISCENTKWVRIDNTSMGMFNIVVLFNYQKISLKDTELKVYSEIQLKDDKGKISSYTKPLNDVVMNKNKGVFPAVFMMMGSAEGIGAMTICVANGDGEIISNKINVPVAGGKNYEKEMEAKFGPARGSPANPW